MKKRKPCDLRRLISEVRKLRRKLRNEFANDIGTNYFQELGRLHQVIAKEELTLNFQEENLLIGSAEKPNDILHFYQLLKSIKRTKFEGGHLSDKNGA